MSKFENRLVEYTSGKVVLGLVEIDDTEDGFGEVKNIEPVAEFSDMEQAQLFIDSAVEALAKGALFEMEDGGFV